MRNKRLVATILGIISALTAQLLWSAPANAADFRFLVPYRFEGIHPNVNRVLMGCIAWQDDGEALRSDSYWVQVAQSPLSASGYRSLSGIATILVRVPSGARPAARWRCNITLINYTPDGGDQTLGTPTQTGTVEELFYRDGSNFEEEGNF